MKLLHLDASALGSHSVSRGLTAAIVAELTANNPGTEVIYHDLAANPLPHWTPVADASDPVAVQGSQMIDEFLAADVIVIGAPMYNFSIPSQLKAWIDRVAVAGKSFRYTANGPEGLAGGKRLIIVSSRGGVYSQGPAQPMDFQEPYLRAVFSFLGITDIEFVRAEGVNLSEDNKVASIKSAHASIGDVARKAA
ncbi:FMN-dependent NADH-azoreductase [Dyella japonica]|uniref:FMN dependent NADH:quinone oxidoreductase n=1 Tax=Dyella japonica A8 TaxID=1217721 RepID=A0A075K141_9GAMM|nr:FMN-dependent NADH-azoreductase [Dyella japonica]AIF47899.1 FMN-dependent NADH-azoreductase [Dyella japonica A8]